MPVLRRAHDLVATFEPGDGPRAPPHPNPGSGPRPHDPQQRLITAQARRSPSPPATARAHPRPIDRAPRTAHHTDIDRPARPRPHAVPRPARSLCRPSGRASPSNTSPTSTPTPANRQIPIQIPITRKPLGLRGFLPWRLSDAGPGRCSLPLDRPASETLHSCCRVGRQTTFANRTAWANIFMQRAGLLEKVGRGVYRIADEGRKVLTESPDRIDMRFLERYPGYAEWRQRSAAGGPAGNGSGITTAAAVATQTPEEQLDTSFKSLNAALEAESARPCTRTVAGVF